MRRPLRYFALMTILLFGGSGCGRQPAEDEPALAESSRTPALQLEWSFEADSAERANALGLLEEAVGRPDGPPRGASGVLYKFDSPSETRFLLLTYVEAQPSDPHPVAVLFALQGMPPRVSAPLPAGRWGLGGFGPVEVADHDGDGGMDVAFCLWPEEEAEDGVAAVHGYLNGAWYVIDAPQRTPPDCRITPH